MNILIAGAGNTGRYLARVLTDAGHVVTLIERNRNAAELGHKESGAHVVHGDASEPSVLEQAGIRGADVVVAATGEDEDNLVIANLSKFEYDVSRVVGRVKNPKNSWLYEPDIGVDVSVSASNTIAQCIREEVTVGEVLRLFGLPQGQAAIVEVTIPSGSSVLHKAIADVSWPPGCIPVAIGRHSTLMASSAEIVLQPNDRLVCLTDVDHDEALHALLTGRGAHASDERS